VAAEILEPQQCDNNYSLTVGSSPNQVQYGRTIKIEATVNEEVTHFSSWYAPNTLINGSNSASDQFVFSASTTIVPSSISTTELTIHRGSSTMDVTWKGEMQGQTTH